MGTDKRVLSIYVSIKCCPLNQSPLFYNWHISQVVLSFVCVLPHFLCILELITFCVCVQHTQRYLWVCRKFADSLSFLSVAARYTGTLVGSRFVRTRAAQSKTLCGNWFWVLSIPPDKACVCIYVADVLVLGGPQPWRSGECCWRGPACSHNSVSYSMMLGKHERNAAELDGA